MSKKSRQLRHRSTASATRIQYLLLTAGAAFLAERLMERAIEGGWRLVVGEEPPDRPEHPDTGWAAALGWTALTGVAVAVAGLAARRGAALGWQHVLDRRIPA